MKPETKLELKRWAIRQLIHLVDAAEDWLHSCQVALREEIAGAAGSNGLVIRPVTKPAGQAVKISPRSAEGGIRFDRPAKTKRRITAAEFDLRFSRS